VCCGLYRARECPITGLLVSHRGREILDRDVTMICCRFLWIGGMKEMNSLYWDGVVFTWIGYFNFASGLAFGVIYKTVIVFQFN
jgi:hypothetical protein